MSVTTIMLTGLHIQCNAQNPFAYMGNVRPSEVMFEIGCVDTIFYESNLRYRLVYYDKEGVFSKEVLSGEGGFFEQNFKYGKWHGIVMDWSNERGIQELRYCYLDRCHTWKYRNGGLESMIGDSMFFGPRGPWSYYYPNGQLRMKGYAGNAPYSDTLYTYHDNGLLESIGLSFGPRVDEDTRLGRWFDYYRNGQLRVSSNYGYDLSIRNGDYRWKEGTWEYYSDSGKLLIVEKWDKGELVERIEY